MKKTIAVLILAVVLLLPICLPRETVAYLTDREGIINEFKAEIPDIPEEDEKINITLRTETENKILIPINPDSKNPDGTYTNSVKNKVFVQSAANTVDSYVRVHVAIPKVLDEVVARRNTGRVVNGETYGDYPILHFDYSDEEGYQQAWSWEKTPYEYTDPQMVDKNGKKIIYNVYVATYQHILKSETETTYPVVRSIYLDRLVTNEDLWDDIIPVYGQGIFGIYCMAEGVGAKEGAKAEEALNAAFGEPGTYDAWADEN